MIRVYVYITLISCDRLCACVCVCVGQWVRVCVCMQVYLRVKCLFIRRGTFIKGAASRRLTVKNERGGASLHSRRRGPTNFPE